MKILTLCVASGIIFSAAGCIVRPERPEDPAEPSFRAITIGMTRDEVVRRVGPPESAVQDAEDAWWYFLGSDHGPAYRIRFEGNRVRRIDRFDNRRDIAELDAEELRGVKPLERP